MFKESNAPTLSSKRGFPRMKEKPPQAPPKEGMYSPQNASFYLKEPLLHVKRAFLRYEGEPPQAPPKEGMYSPQNASFYLKEPLFHARRAFPCLEESLSLF